MQKWMCLLIIISIKWHYYTCYQTLCSRAWPSCVAVIAWAILNSRKGFLLGRGCRTLDNSEGGSTSHWVAMTGAVILEKGPSPAFSRWRSMPPHMLEQSSPSVLSQLFTVCLESLSNGTEWPWGLWMRWNFRGLWLPIQVGSSADSETQISKC